MRTISNFTMISGLGFTQQNNAATLSRGKTFRSVSKFQNNNTIVVRAQELRSNFLYQTSQDFLNIQYMSESN